MPINEELDKIYGLLCSPDESNRDLAVALLRSLGLSINWDDWAFLRPSTDEKMRQKDDYIKRFFRSAATTTDVVFEAGFADNLFPYGLFKLPQIDSLRYAALNITEVPDEIAFLTNLTEVMFFNMPHLQRISPRLQALPRLQGLHINNCPVLCCDDDWGNFPALERLHLAGVNLHTTLTKGFTHAPRLNMLNISRCIFDVPLPKHLAEMPQLSHLSIYQSTLHDHNKPFILPPNLISIRFDESPLEQVPQIAFQHYPKLSAVTINKCGLKKLPPKYFPVGSNLFSLKLDHNKIEKLPDSIGNLKHLTTLSAQYNQISHLPDSITECSNLRMLLLNGNPLNPKEILRIREALPDCKISF